LLKDNKQFQLEKVSEQVYSIAQKSLDIRQYACGIFMQSNEISDCASYAHFLCGIALEKKEKALLLVKQTERNA